MVDSTFKLKKTASLDLGLGPRLGQLVGGSGSTAPRPQAPPVPPPQLLTPPPAPVPVVPAAPVTNPFAALPFRSPGDRIRADDFNALAKGLQIIGDAYVLSGALFSLPFAQAKLHLTSQQYEITRVVSVFGAELSTLDDASLDTRKVLQVVPVVLGERRVMVVVTESVETRRFVPPLKDLTYREAIVRQQGAIGEGTFSAPVKAFSLISHSLKDAAELVSQ